MPPATGETPMRMRTPSLSSAGAAAGGRSGAGAGGGGWASATADDKSVIVPVARAVQAYFVLVFMSFLSCGCSAAPRKEAQLSAVSCGQGSGEPSALRCRLGQEALVNSAPS